MAAEELLLRYEAPLRLGFFLGVFLLVALWELTAPRRALTVAKAARWLHNLLLVGLNTVLVRLIFPAAAAGFAAVASERGWGVFNVVEAPEWVAFLASVALLDLTIYLQHVMFHAVPALWRLHRVHHADLDFDVTTGARFHPVEILLSMGIKLAAVAVLGPPVAAVIVFEILLNATAMFNHGNVRLPRALDRVLRRVVVTPDMHRVHHSVEDDEANSNFGFNLPWWDRLFGTYRDQPRAGHEAMAIGVRRYRDPALVDRLPGMLLLPLRPVHGYAINRRAWEGSDAA